MRDKIKEAWVLGYETALLDMKLFTETQKTPDMETSLMKYKFIAKGAKINMEAFKVFMGKKEPEEIAALFNYMQFLSTHIKNDIMNRLIETVKEFANENNINLKNTEFSSDWLGVVGLEFNQFIKDQWN